jgi:hypothetical protein
MNIMIVTRHPRDISRRFSFHLVVGSWESPPSIWFRVTRKPECNGLVKDSRVKDWLWLGKVLAPLAHPSWGKLLRGFDVLKEVLKILSFHQILEIRLTCEFIILNREQIKILNSSSVLRLYHKKNIHTKNKNKNILSIHDVGRRLPLFCLFNKKGFFSIGENKDFIGVAI